MSTPVASAATAAEEQRFVLGRVSWPQYEAILDAIGERAGVRITYLDGRLTLLSPTRRHDWYEHAVCRLIEAVADGLDLTWEPAGHTTYRREDVAGGVEGDGAYYFGEHAAELMGPTDVDLTAQSPPGLAIEVEHAHRAGDAIEVWRRIGVPEIWRLDVRRWSLAISLRQDDGSYRESSASRSLEPLRPQDVLDWIKHAESMSMSRWCRQLPARVQEMLRARPGD